MWETLYHRGKAGSEKCFPQKAAHAFVIVKKMQFELKHHFKYGISCKEQKTVKVFTSMTYYNYMQCHYSHNCHSTEDAHGKRINQSSPY